MVIILLIWYFDLSGNSTSCFCFAFTFSRSSFCAHRRFLMGTGVVFLFWAPECCCHSGVVDSCPPLLAQKTELVTLWFWSLWVYVGPPIFKKNSSRMLSRECSLKLLGFLGNFRGCLVCVFKQLFSVFKQHFMHFNTFFHPHVFPQMFLNNNFQFLNTQTKWALKFLRCHIHFFFFPGWLRGCVEVGGIKLAKHWSSHLVYMI